MMKRLTWFVGGVAAGAIGAARAKRKVRSVASDYAPVQVARRATERVRRRGHDVADAVREGRRAMRMKELELRARANTSVTTLADELEDGAEVIVDGRPVPPAQIIVLRPVTTVAGDTDADSVPTRTRRIARPRRRASGRA